MVEDGVGVGPDAVRGVEVDEEQADAAVVGDVPHGEEHPVAVVAREHQRRRVDDPDEAGGAALVGDGRVAVGVDGAEEEEGSGFDEGLRVVVDVRLDGGELEGVGKGSGVEAVLESAVVVVVEGGHGGLLSVKGGRSERP